MGQLAALIEAPSTFRMLNDPGTVCGPKNFSIAERGIEYIMEDLDVAKSTMMKCVPNGKTPLSEHIREIQATIKEMEPILRRDGTRVGVVWRLTESLHYLRT